MSLSAWTLQNPSTGQFPIGEATYRERTTSGTASFGDSSSAQKIYIVDWANHTSFLDDLFGYSVFASSAITGILGRILPEEHADYKRYYVMDASVKPAGGFSEVEAGRASKWPVAEITAKFQPVLYDVLEDGDITSETQRFCSRTYAPKGEYLTLPAYSYKFVNTYGIPKPGDPAIKVSLSTNPGILSSTTTMKVTWHQVPGLPPDRHLPPQEARAIQFLAKLNSTEFFKNPPGTVLFTEFDPKLVAPKHSDGTFFWDLNFTFEIRNNGKNVFWELATDLDPTLEWCGHNFIFSVITNQYDLVTAGPTRRVNEAEQPGDAGNITGTRLYRFADLNKLFSFVP